MGQTKWPHRVYGQKPMNLNFSSIFVYGDRVEVNQYRELDAQTIIEDIKRIANSRVKTEFIAERYDDRIVWSLYNQKDYENNEETFSEERLNDPKVIGYGSIEELIEFANIKRSNNELKPNKEFKGRYKWDRWVSDSQWAKYLETMENIAKQTKNASKL